jgi:RHS repeat-associated protein
MVQAKAKRRGSSVRKFLAGVRRGYLPWMAQNVRHLHSNAVGSALSTMREVRISRHRPRRIERQGPMFEILEPRLLLSALPTPFATINIGSPSMADSAIYVSANNQWQVTGAGAGANGHADHFSYTAENWTGSGSLTADLGTLADTGANAQAGVMIRDTSAASSGFAAVMENPNGTISLEYRNGYGNSVIVSTTSAAINPAWVRLSETQSGNTDSFTGLYSTDGVNWTAINATPINITFTQSTNLAGLAVASGNPSQSQTVNFNSFSATPANFTDQDIGTPGIAGSATYDPGTGNWTVNGGGADIYGSGDHFNFAGQSFTGNGSIAAQVNNQTDTNAWAKAGVMFRNTSATDSAFADVVATPGHGVAFQWRSSTGGGSSSTAVTGIAAPVWVKLTRIGDKFTGYYSTDGTTWTQIGGSQTVDIAPTALAGLAVTAHNNSAVSTATFSHVAITDPSLPTGWSDADIGSPGLLGGASYDSSTGVWTVNGGGADIWGYGDQFNFASESFTGDGQIIAQVNSQTDTNVSAKAGVMFRNTSDPASAFADVIVTPGAGVEFQWRPLAYSKCFSANVTGVTAPVWVKLMRVGNNFSAFYSSDGTTWTQIGQTQYIAMNTSAMAGLAVTAHNNSALSTATFANVSVAPAAAAPSAVTNLAVAAVNAAQINVSWTDPNTAANETDLLIQRSIDDVNFTTVSMAAQGTTSYTDNALTGATTYYYRVLAENAGNLAAASNTASATTAASSLPASWNTTAIGTSGGSGSYATGGTFSITSTGNIAADIHAAYYIGAPTDSFNYVYQSLGSNQQIVAQINSQTNTGPQTKAGLMIRAGGDANAAFVGIFLSPSEGVAMLARNAAGDQATDPGYDGGYTLASGAIWLKLVLQNGVISGYVSTNDVDWSLVGQTSAVALGAAPVIGLAADSGGSSSSSTAAFTNVSVGAATSQTLVPEMPYYMQAEAFSATDGRVTWAALQDATSFNVQQSTDNGQTWSLVASGGTGSEDTYLPENLSPNTTYLFRVQAVNANGGSPYSSAVSMTTGASTSWGMYLPQPPVTGPVSSSLETNVTLSSASQPVYAASWESAQMLSLSGSVTVPQLGAQYTVGSFTPASSGGGSFGSSGVLVMPSDPGVIIQNTNTSQNNTSGVNNNYGELGSNPNQKDTPPGTGPGPNPGPCPGASGSPVAYSSGSPEITSPGLSSTGFGSAWGTSLNWTTTTVFTPSSMSGNGWSSGSGGFIENIGGGDNGANPDVVVVGSAYSQLQFNYNTGTGQYRLATPGDSGENNVLTHNSTGGTYTMTDTSGNQYVFYDFSGVNAANVRGLIKQQVDAQGNATIYAYNSSGQLTTVTQTDAVGDTETFIYSYISTGVNAGRVSLIQQSIQRAGQTSATLYRQMALTYYDGSYSGNMQYGNVGDLQTVTIEDGGGNVIGQSYYRYYTPADLTQSGNTVGFVGGLQYDFGPNAFARLQEALAAYNTANGTSYDAFDAPASIVAPYADHYFQYNSNHQVTLESFSQGGSTAANGLGTQTYAYSQNPNFVVGDSYNTWMVRTTQTLQDGNQNIVYTNVNGDELMNIFVDNTDSGNPTNQGKVWITATTYDSQGRQLDTISPSAINLSASILNGATTASAIEAAIEPYADLGISEGLVYSNTGLINSATYYGSTTATTTAPGGAAGYVEADYVQQGSSGTPIEQDSYTYIQHLDYNGNTIFPEATVTQYQSSANNGSTPETTTYSYSWQDNSSGYVTNQIADLTTTNPVVSTSQNGSGTATTTQTVYNQYGQPVWTMDAKGFITYTAYDNATGAVIQSVQDVNTANLSDLANYSGTYPGGTLTFGTNGYNQYGVPQLPAGWATPTGGGLNLVTTNYVDNLGRTIEQISPGGDITLYVYDDANHAMFTLAGVILDTSNNTLTTTGPITMARTRIAYNYDFANVNYSGTYTETMAFSANTPISYTGGTGGQPVVPVLPGFIQGTGTPVGSAANTQPNNVLNLVGNGTSSAPQFSIQTLSRTLYDSGGQQVETDSYQSVNNTIYLATAPGQGYSGSLITNPTSPDQTGNYFASYMAYDVDGRMYKVVDNNGTITDTLYDSLGRVVSDWVGTNDTTSNGQPFTGSNAGTGNNMTEVQSYVYDNNSVGDSNVTEVVQYPDGTANTGTQRVSVLNYDFRDRLVATETGLTLNSSRTPVTSSSDPYPLITVSSLDNLGDVTATLTFNGAATTIANAIAAAASAAPGAVLAGLIGYRTSEYDSQNRDYEDQTYSVDPTTGTISTAAETTYTFYGPRGNVIEAVAPTGQVTKNVYNGVGELVDVYVTDGGAVNNGGSTVLTYAAAESVSNDVVISQTAYGYNGDGNLIETVHAQRFNTDPILGTSAEGALFTDTVNADGSLTVTPASNTNSSLGARIYYSATYYDAADRQIATVNAGTNPTGTNGAATPWTRPANAPISVNDSNFPGDLITLTSYNAAGQIYETIDPRGIVAANFYNSLGETVETIAAYDPSVNGGNPTNDQNQTTLYTFDGLGDQTSMTAEDPSTGNQTTDYVYGVSAATGSTITSNDLLYQTVYPSNGQNDTVSQEYNALGQVIQGTDRNGDVHQYTYDTAGREISDTVTTLGAGVDGSVRRVDTTYNAQGLAYLLTSYADTAGTTIVNQVENIYNGLGQLAFQYQALTGAVDVSTTPYVQYTYSSAGNGSRLASMAYPNGRTIDYNYSGTNLNSALDNAIGRLDSISDGANSGDSGQVLEQYSYLGLSTIIARNHPQTGINLTLLGSAGSIGSGGDQYVGLDQFGRIADQNWVNTSTGMSANNFTYSYDASSNVTAENNLLDTAYSQTFTYDPLNRLASNTLGGAANQSWTLDSQGNWSSFTSNGTTQTETANAQNQITGISGGATPAYDANGNMISDQSGNTYVYNAWNQLVSVSNSSGTVIAQYTYDARGYRVSETYPVGGNGVAAGTTKYLYYSNQEQVIEERWNGTANSNTQYQYIWSAKYVNAMVLRDTYSGGAIQSDSRIYTTYDANYNVTSLIGYESTTQTWGVTERFTYSPYGTVTVLSSTWTVQSDAYSWQYMYQGGRQDPITGLYHFDHREYSATLGRFISQDPLQYINGANTYQFVMGNPVNAVDPEGTVTLPPGIVGPPPPSPSPSGSLWPAYPPTGGFSGTWWYPVPLPGGTISLTGGVGGSLGQNGGYGINGVGGLKFSIPPLIPYIPNSIWSVCVIGSGTGSGPHGKVQGTGFVVIKVKF